MDVHPTALDTPVWLRSELLESGHCDRELAALVRSGSLHRIRHGAYADGPTYRAADGPGRHAMTVRAVVQQAKTEVVPSHLSSLPFHSVPMWGMPLDVVHVTRPDGRAGRAEAGIRQHQGAILDGDVVERHGLAVMSATRTALDVTTCCSTEASLVVVNELLHRGLTSPEELGRRNAPRAKDPYTLRTDLVLRLADGRLESVGESRSFWMMYRYGVPAPVPQFEVIDSAGRVFARLDFAWPELKAWLEFDGREKYLKFLRDGDSVTDAVLREKQRESRIAELTGWRCIRITWADLESPNATIARILAVLGVPSRAPAFTF
jgi:hypothetical protein